MRLTAEMKRALIQVALDKRFAKEKAEVERLRLAVGKAERKAGDLAYKAAFSKAHHTTMELLPMGWLPTVHTIRVQVEGVGVTELTFNGNMRVPNSLKGYAQVSDQILKPNSPALVAKKTHHTAMEAYEQAHSKHREARSDLKTKTKAALARITTTKRLEDQWPELFALLPIAETAPAIGGLPVIPFDVLNQELRL